MSIYVKVAGGTITEYRNGSCYRSYGSNIAFAMTLGRNTVIAVTKRGRVQEYRNGSLQKTFGSGVVSAYESSGVVYATLKSGKVQEYKNGSLIKQY